MMCGMECVCGWSGEGKTRRRETSWKSVSVVEAIEDGGLYWMERRAQVKVRNLMGHIQLYCIH